MNGGGGGGDDEPGRVARAEQSHFPPINHDDMKRALGTLMKMVSFPN